MILRHYQDAAKTAFYEHLQSRDDNPLIVIPTGGGKSPLMAAICRDVVRLWGGRILVLAHVRELLEQTADKIRRTDPTLNVGLYSAGLNAREKSQPITVAGIQSIYKRAHEFLPWDVILIDEAHLVSFNDDSMYRSFLKDCKIINPAVRIGGLTATAYRLDVGEICTPDGIFNHVAYEISVNELIRDGFLSKIRGRNGVAKANLSEVHIRGGEYKPDEMAAAFDQESLVADACREIIELTAERKAVLVFCSSVEHGEHVTSCLRDTLDWFSVGFITGETPSEERRELLEKFQAGAIKYMVNVNVLTTGFDATRIDCVVLLRATLSCGLYYQMVGRGFRVHPGKADCIVLDYGTNIERHGPVDCVKVKTKSGEDGVAPVKECPQCHEVIHAAYRQCTECGYEFPKPELKHGSQASGKGVISGDVTEAVYEIRSVRYSLHHKKGTAPGDAPPTLRVDYLIGWEKWQSEWVCLSHTGFARTKAETWWKERTTIPVPPSTEDGVILARAGVLTMPTSITVREVAGERFPRIVKSVIPERFTPGEDFEMPMVRERMPLGFNEPEDRQPGTMNLETEEIPFSFLPWLGFVLTIGSLFA